MNPPLSAYINFTIPSFLVALVLFQNIILANGATQSEVAIENYSFESGKSGWKGTGSVGSKYGFAAPSGVSYASLSPGQHLSQQNVITSTKEDSTYLVTFYARSMNPLGTEASSEAKVSFQLDNGGTKVEHSKAVTVDPSLPKGAASEVPNDDGGNVWFDGNYRLQASEVIMFQRKDKDPLKDLWYVSSELPEPANYAPGPIHTPQGLKSIYATAAANGKPVADGCVDACDDCEAEGDCATAVLPDGCLCEATIIPVHLTGTAPNYGFRIDPRGPVLKHSSMKPTNVFTSYFPSPGDAHLFYDDDTDRLWMVWGGWTLYVTELDPSTGRMLGDPEDVEVDNCINSNPSCATPVLSFAPSIREGGKGQIPDGWEGDEWSAASYVEGPALFKHGGYWYALGSYGDLDRDYTIRMCRNSSPNPNEGSFVDKDGLDCTVFQESVKRYGCSMLLGAEGIQDVPGHPHIWKEDDGRFFLGYDFRYKRGNTSSSSNESLDFFGIRELQWVDGWPTIWSKIELEFEGKDFLNLLDDAGDSYDLDSLTLSLKLESIGSGVVGIDRVSITVTDPAKPPTTFSTNSPTAADIDACVDQPLTYKDKPKWDCNWVGGKADKRCNKVWNNLQLSEYCPVACDAECNSAPVPTPPVAPVPTPTVAPFATPTGDACVDQPLAFKNKSKWDCDWVAQKAQQRCSKNWKNKQLSEYCPLACNAQCNIAPVPTPTVAPVAVPTGDACVDQLLAYKDKSKWDCAWVGGKADKRCNKVWNNMKLSEYCPVACDVKCK